MVLGLRILRRRVMKESGHTGVGPKAHDLAEVSRICVTSLATVAGVTGGAGRASHGLECSVVQDEVCVLVFGRAWKCRDTLHAQRCRLGESLMARRTVQGVAEVCRGLMRVARDARLRLGPAYEHVRHRHRLGGGHCAGRPRFSPLDRKQCRDRIGRQPVARRAVGFPSTRRDNLDMDSMGIVEIARIHDRRGPLDLRLDLPVVTCGTASGSLVVRHFRIGLDPFVTSLTQGEQSRVVGMGERLLLRRARPPKDLTLPRSTRRWRSRPAASLPTPARGVAAGSDPKVHSTLSDPRT